MKLKLTAQCLLGLGLGILAGMLLPASSGLTETTLGVAGALTRLWTNALQLVVMPLVVAQLFTTISAHRGTPGEAARLGLVIPAVFALLLLYAILVSMAVTSGLTQLPVFGNLTLEAPAVAPVAPAIAAPEAGGASLIDGLVPNNLVAAAGANALLALMLFALVFALAARRIATELQDALDLGARAVRDAMFVLLEWLIRLAPLVLLAFGLKTAAASGLLVGEVLIVFTFIALAVYSACTLALYPVAVLLGGVSLSRFARALFPAQAVAVATRSSMATVPALLREAELTLRLPGKTAALVIPLGGGILKLSRAASGGAKLLFLAAVLDLPLQPQQVVVFIATILLLSPTTQGVPRVMAGGRSLPAYVAIGIAPEYYFLLSATTALTDVVQTVLNSTAYLTSAVLVSRFTSRRTAPDLAAVPADAPVSGALSDESVARP